MREMIRPLIKLIIVFLIVGVFVNDIGAYILARYNGQEAATKVAGAFAGDYKGASSVNSAITKARQAASDSGVIFTSYKINKDSINVEIELKVEKTVIIKRVKALENFSKVKIEANADLM